MRNIFRNRFGYLRQHGFKAYVIALSNKLGKRASKLGGVLKRASNRSSRLTDKILRPLLGQRYLDYRSRRFWAKSKDSYLASEAYYNAQEDALRDMLTSISGPRRDAIDVGCADGRFTLVIAGQYGKAIGLDISKELVRKAKAKAEQLGASNVVFEQVDLTRGFPKGEYDLVSCMGVTSAVVGDDAFNDFVTNLFNSTRRGGMLITKDSLSPGEYWEKMHDPYVAVYRNETAYLNKFSELGLRLVKKVELARSRRLVNYICLWEKR